MPSFDVQGALSAGYSAADIADEMSRQGGFDAAGARKAGYSDDEIIGHLQAGSTKSKPKVPDAPPDTSMSSAFGYGVDNTAHALGDTAEVLGAPGLGKTLQGVNMAPKGYQPADITGAIRDGRYGDILPNMARKGVEMLPAVGGLAGAAALTPEALGTAGALGVAGAGSAALHYGQNVKASAANNGDATPTRGDYVRGALTTLPQAGLDAVGLRVPGLGSMASSTLGKAGVRTLADAATGAASDQVGQVGTSIGTKAGLQDNPMQSAEAALGALPARAMSQAPGLVKAGIKTGSDATMSRLVDQPVDADHAAAIEQANQAIDSARASAKGKISATTAANSAKSQLVTDLKTTFDALREANPDQITPADTKGFGATLNQALRHNNATGDSHSLDTATLLDQVGSLNLPAEATGPLVSGLRALDVLSNASFQKQQVGPFRAIGSAAANVGALAAPLMAGNLPGGLEAGLGLAVGHNVAGKMGGAVGGAVDNFMGTNTPVAVLQRAAAQRMLAKAGVATPGDPVAALQAVRASALQQGAQTPDVEALGQSALDTNAHRNAVLLAAASKVPNTAPGVDAVASDAAVAQARQRAAAVMRAAGIEPPDELGNTPDPVPVNTPIRGPAQQPSGAPPAAPQAQAPVAPMGMPQPAPVVPQAAPGGQPAVPPWMRYVMNGDPRVTPAHVDQAIDAHVANGGISPQLAAQLRAHQGIAQPDLLGPIQAHALQFAGVPVGRGAVGLPATKTQAQFGPAPTDPSVSRPAAYLYSTQAYHLDAGRLADAAQAAGMPAVKETVENIEHTRDPVEKARLRAAFLSSLPAADRQAAAPYLPDRLVTHGKK